jgi:hypothetical protein
VPRVVNVVETVDQDRVQNGLDSRAEARDARLASDALEGGLEGRGQESRGGCICVKKRLEIHE